MATSGTKTFNPDYAEMVTEAFERCGIRPNQITTDFLQSARRSCNLLLEAWTVKGYNLWKVDLIEIPMLSGVAVYQVPSDTINLLDCYLTQVSGGADIPMPKMGRTEYSNIPNKAQVGRPNQLWFERVPVPKVHVYMVPPSDGQYILKCYRINQFEDAGIANAETSDLVYRMHEPFIAGLAAKLSEKFAPDREDKLLAKAKISWDEATADDREGTPITIMPNFSDYYR